MKNSYRVLTASALFVMLSTQALGNDSLPAETWHCFDLSDIVEEKIVIELTREQIPLGETYGSGEVSASGIVHQAQFTINGLNRRWDFVTDADGRFDYAFIISPSGRGAYYDFSRNETGVSPSHYYNCISP